MVPTPPTEQETADEEHLRLLSIFHYVVGGLAAVFACFPIFHLGMGLFMVFASQKFGGPGNQPPTWMGLFLIAIAIFFIVLGWSFAAAVVIAGRFLARRKHHTFCLVMGGVECIFMPFGTVLGVFTIFVLMRPSAKQLFQANRL